MIESSFLTTKILFHASLLLVLKSLSASSLSPSSTSSLSRSLSPSSGPWLITRADNNRFYQGKIQLIKSRDEKNGDNNDLISSAADDSPFSLPSSSDSSGPPPPPFPIEMSPRSYNPGPRSFGSRPRSPSTGLTSNGNGTNMIRTLIRTRSGSNNNNGNNNGNNRIGSSSNNRADAGGSSNSNNDHGDSNSKPKFATGPVIEFNDGHETASISNNDRNKVQKSPSLTSAGFLGTDEKGDIFPDVDGLVKGEFVSKKVIGEYYLSTS